LEIEARQPSASQIAAVADRLAAGGAKEALRYLEKQKKRAPRMWAAWQPFHSRIVDLVQDLDAAQALEALRVWQDMVTARAVKERKR